MKVYLDVDGQRQLLGRAEIPDSQGPTIDVPLFGRSSVIVEQFTIGVVTHLSADGGLPVAERAVIASPGQLVMLLPGWQPLAS